MSAAVEDPETGQGPEPRSELRTAGLALRSVSAAIGGRDLFSDLNLSVGPGEIATVMGPSGAGKSALLSHICGVGDPDFSFGGSVALNGLDVGALPASQRRIGVLFQDALLFPHLSVGENIAFGLPTGLGRDERNARIAAALADAGLTGMGGRDPATLSGGQKARAALMRTLLAEPKAVLLDEPFSKLDAALRDKFRRFVFDHVRERALPTLLVTHDPADAAAAAGPVVELAPP